MKSLVELRQDRAALINQMKVLLAKTEGRADERRAAQGGIKALEARMSRISDLDHGGPLYSTNHLVFVEAGASGCRHEKLDDSGAPSGRKCIVTDAVLGDGSWLQRYSSKNATRTK